MAKVLKPFPYSVNGVDVEHLVPGDERDFGRFTAGLEKEGFIAKSGGKPAAREMAADEAREVAADAAAPEVAAEETETKPKNRTRK